MNPAKLVHGLYIFAELTRHSAIQATADALGTTRSTVSQQLSRLEKQLGVKLFLRSNQGVSLTQAGKVLAPRARTIQDLTNNALQEVAFASDQPEGSLRISVPHAIEGPVLIPALEKLLSLYPRVVPYVETSDRIVDMVSQRIDIALRVGPLEDSDLVAVRVGQVFERVMASPSYAEHHCVSHPHDLARLQWITTGWQRRRKSLTFEGDEKSIDIPQLEGLSVTNLPTAASFAAIGLGVAFLPWPYGESWIRDGALVELLPSLRVAPRDVHAIHPFQRQAPTAVRTLIDLVRERFSELANTVAPSRLKQEP